MVTTRTLTLAVALALGAAAPATAYAQTPTAEARAAFQEGVQQYANRQFAEALESFRRAYRLRPHPSVLVNIANCYMNLDRPADAASTFERFLADPTTSPSPQQRAEIERALTEARSRMATITVIANPAGSQVYLDGDLVGASPLRQPIRTGPGPHVIEARERGGASVQRQVRVDGGGTMTITLDVTGQRTYVGSVPPELNPPAPVAVVTPPTPPAPVVVTPTPVPVVTPPVAVAPAAPVTPAPLAVMPPTAAPVLPPPGGGDRPTTRSVGLPGAFWGGLAVTTAALGTAIGFFVYAESLASDFATIRRVYEGENDPMRRQYYYELALSYSDAVEQNRTVAWVFTGVAAAGAAFTIAAPFLFRSRSTSATRASLRVAPTFDRPGVVLGGTF